MPSSVDFPGWPALFWREMKEWIWERGNTSEGLRGVEGNETVVWGTDVEYNRRIHGKNKNYYLPKWN